MMILTHLPHVLRATLGSLRQALQPRAPHALLARQTWTPIQPHRAQFVLLVNLQHRVPPRVLHVRQDKWTTIPMPRHRAKTVLSESTRQRVRLHAVFAQPGCTTTMPMQARLASRAHQAQRHCPRVVASTAMMSKLL